MPQPAGFAHVMAFALVAVFSFSTAAAQTAARPATPIRGAASGALKRTVADGDTPSVPKDPSAPVTPAEATPEAGANPQETQLKQQMLQKIQQLRIDRRPSSILKAWAEPEAKDDAKETKEDVKTPDASDDAAKLAAAIKEFDQGLKELQRDVTLGHWERVGSFIDSLDEDAGKALYAKLLSGLRAPPTTTTRTSTGGATRSRMPEKNALDFDDVLAIVEISPVDLEDSQITSLGLLIRLAFDNGNIIDALMIRLREIVAASEEMRFLDKNQAARLLIAAGRSIEAGEFLPTLDEVKTTKDSESLNLLTTHLLAKFAEENKRELLEQAWDVTQIVLASEETEKEQKDEALRRAVDLAPKLRKELGDSWLEESFTSQPQRGMEIIAAIGTSAAKALSEKPSDSSFRLKSLQLQTTAVEALLRSSPERADEWKGTLTLLAGNWLREAEVSEQFDSSTTLGPQLRRDQFGNYFYYNAAQLNRPTSSTSVRAVSTGELLDIKPSDQWLAKIEPAGKPKYDMVFAKLYLKVAEDEKAFPFIEQLAESHPDLAKELVDDYLQVWTQNHDPNRARNRTNMYMFMYGFERRKEAIPLTRSKQKRNLDELAELVDKLRELELGDLNEQLLAKAFTTCHSVAEVYRIEDIERVFGSLEKLDPKTLAEMTQQMRANLMSVWRQPAVQKNAGTKRKQKDIQAEVIRGYEVARTALESGLAKYPEDWALRLAKAALMHDENNYRREVAADSKFVDRREQALKEFAKAAALYVAEVANGKLEEEDETTKAFDIWFYASLGASDLNQVSEETPPAKGQSEQIREAILKLGEPVADRHMAMFANSLFTRMSAANPAVKFRYLRTGFEIVGDHKQAREARKVFEYYQDLVTEIKLEAEIDGSDIVGYEEPFGVFVNLRHTREIERESGGFSRYLQNQNTNTAFSYNYGRPTQDYRTKFEESVRQAMNEHFEVLSVTFQSEDVNSRATEQYGWRVTPYAYVMLRARGPEVDAIPPLQLDLDFLDTSGYVVIPIESPTVPVDARPEEGLARPLKDLAITQTLDERQADEGKLILELKATGLGLIPNLDKIVNFENDDFEIASTDDQGLAVSRFDPDSEETEIISERTWLVTFEAKENLEQLPSEFRFATPKVETKEVLFQRYDDADLRMVESSVSLEKKYGATSNVNKIIIALLGVVALLGLIALIVLRPTRTSASVAQSYAIPDNVTPFTVIGLLREIYANHELTAEQKEELGDSIQKLEEQYFSGWRQEESDLEEIASHWIHKSQV